VEINIGCFDTKNKRNRISASNVAYARQQATIVGLGAESFDKAVEQIAKIAYEVELAFEDSDVLAWTAQDAGVDGTHLQATCRYFTTGKEPPTNQVVDFTKHVVPAGVLSRMLSKGVYHCIDNEVLYLDLEGDK
jgi:2-hydroxychromene-2-carboxylate isomerase